MDFSGNRSAAPAPASAGGARKSKTTGGKFRGVPSWVGAVVVVVVVVLAAWLLFSNVGGNKESGLVKKDKLQAVFLNTGQVYFGNVTALNNRYLELSNIYYLQTSQGGETNTNSNVSLVKLGCELHEPFDKMVVNRDQITFWENLQDTGQVAKAVKTFEQQNPQGQKCADQSSAASTNSGNSSQPAGTSTPAGANGTSNTGTGTNAAPAAN